MAEHYNREWAKNAMTIGWYEVDHPDWVHRYPADGRGIVECKKCGRRFPDQYGRSMKNFSRSRRGEQYFKLAAWNNFKRHLDTCKGKD